MQTWQKNLRLFNAWLAGIAGQHFLQLELPVLLNSLRVYDQLSEKNNLLIYNGHHYQHVDFGYRNVIKIASDSNNSAVDVVAAPFALPFANEVADALILPYVLECTANIAAVITESHRVLKPQGVIFICGLNSLSLLRWQSRNVSPFNELGFLGIDELQRELFLQSFDLLDRTKFSFCGVQSSLKPWAEKLGKYFWPYLGNGFVLSMQKRVEILTPLPQKLVWPTNAIPIKNTRLANAVTEP